MREIKFRVWVKGFKKDKSLPDLKMFQYEESDFPKMVDALAVYSETDFTFRNGMCISSSADYDAELMQYTGLKDANGTEIYEGDILEYFFSKDDSLRDTGIVEFKEHRGWPQCLVRSIPGDDFFAYYPDAGEMRMKVIGNCFENPELLEVKEP
jgi:uncharacterized phage protein (TIGR01671 family)